MCIIVMCSLKSMCVPSFILIGCCVSEFYMAIYVPIVMYGLRLFIVVLQELHCLPNCLHVFMIRVRGYCHITMFRYSIRLVSEIAKCIAWGCLLVFYKNYINLVYHIVYMFL